MKIAIGNDQHGLAYKRLIMEAYPEHEYMDVGAMDETPVSYPDYAETAAVLVMKGKCDRAILICGTGIGMAIAANKVKGCYAAVCHDAYSTERSILSNNANVMCMGALVIGKKTCEMLAGIWLSLKFDPSSHSRANVERILKIEEKN
ncbi:MAG TPA: RpiB/LacA/LacB family sugar-phosphate isomerase [Clostridia bacterium]|nr:RpiB/LacA/LacB family sugar-phosphate isomerase [Clostridia bacterium]